jgi:hypothetical protein
MVGTLLGWLGGLLLPGPVDRLSGSILAGVFITSLVRELGWLNIPLLQPRRQTLGIWSRVFPWPVPAALWGFDIGLVFTTWFKFSGIWLLTAIVVVFGQPKFGALLFTAYWLGRALSVWIATVLMPNANATPVLLSAIQRQGILLQRMNALGSMWAGIVLAASSIFAPGI